MAASGDSDSVTVLDKFQVEPGPKEHLVSKMSLRLTYFDMLWLYGQPVQRLLFYEFPGITQTIFLEQCIPKLQRSLSMALRKYLPLAGNLIIPPNQDSGWPEIVYIDPDSVTLIAAESNADFNYLTADHAINCSELHPLVPELAQKVNDSGSTLSSVFAVQATLFPNQGISLGLTNHPAAGDGRSMYLFVKHWGIHAEFEKNVEKRLGSISLPFYYRTQLRDREGTAKSLWSQWEDIVKQDLHPSVSRNADKVRRTFLFKGESITKLKSKFPRSEEDKHQVTFKAVCAYIWTCLVKSQAQVEDVDGEEELEHKLVLFGHCRRRIHRLVDSNYFGNCLTICKASGKHRQLVEEGALQYGFELIKSALNEKLAIDTEITYDKHPCGALKKGKEWLKDLRTLDMERDVLVANTPGFNYYNMRFGWGRPVKFEFVSIDKIGAISLCGHKDYRRGNQRSFELGLCLPKTRMDAFAAIFYEGLKSL